MIDAAAVAAGDRVVVIDAGHHIHPAIACAIPRQWQRRKDTGVVNHSGAFPKVWVRFPGRIDLVPWPVEDVFTDARDAVAAVAART
jgi:hypothetical protein